MTREHLFSIEASGPLIAGAQTTLRFRITVGAEGFAEGGSVRIATPNMGWGQPLCPTPRIWPDLHPFVELTHNPWARLNTTAALNTSGTARLRLWSCCSQFSDRKTAAPVQIDAEIFDRFRQWRWWIVGVVERGSLAGGDEIVITYGDRDADGTGIRVQPWPEAHMDFAAVVDAQGNGRYSMMPGSPVFLDVLPAPPERVVAVLPSIAAVGDQVPLKTAVLDRHLCPPDRAWDGTLSVESVGADVCADLSGIAAPVQGIHRLFVRGPAEGARTNPVVVERDPPERIYWGDLHAQSMYHQWQKAIQRGDSHRTPLEVYAYARESAMLDFVAITDGASPYADRPGWETIQAAAVECYAPGRFVTFKGWEYGGGQGDKCVIYRSAQPEGPVPRPTASDRFATPFRALAGFYREHPERVLTIPHHFMKHMDWSFIDPELDRVMEVYSCWGSYESRTDDLLNAKRRPARQSARYAWSMGALLGITAAGDSHLGYPGRSLPYGDRYWCQCFKAGLCAVFAPDLTREAIWDGLYDRRCYGTTGARIVLRFTINGRPMGSVLEYDDGDARLATRDIRVTVAGTDLIRHIDVIKNNALLHRHEPYGETAEFSLRDSLALGTAGRDWYYVRVWQADGNAAWSSPIWVGPARCETAAHTANE